MIRQSRRIRQNHSVAIERDDGRLDPEPLNQLPGRFDRVITIGPPNDEERLAILRVHARGRPFAPDIAFADIARRTAGLNGAELEQLLRDASMHAVRDAVAGGLTANEPLTISNAHLSYAMQARHAAA